MVTWTVGQAKLSRKQRWAMQAADAMRHYARCSARVSQAFKSGGAA